LSRRRRRRASSNLRMLDRQFSRRAPMTINTKDQIPAANRHRAYVLGQVYLVVGLRQIATRSTPAARSLRTSSVNPLASWRCRTGRPPHRRRRPHTPHASPTPSPPLPLVHPTAQPHSVSSTKPHQVSALLLDAHCTALEAHGPIASPQRRAAGPRGTSIGPRRASINSDDPAATGSSTNTHIRPRHIPWWISEHQLRDNRGAI
jgi:hypothetical protein